MLRLLCLFLLAAPPAVRFEKAVLPFVLENSPTAEKYLPETMAGGVATFDYNNDGRPDIFFSNGASLSSMRKDERKFWNRLYRNEGGGKFTDVTAEAGLQGSGYSIAVAAGDFNNDGNVDLFVAGVNENHLYRNLGNGKFQDVTKEAGIASGRWAAAAGWFDFDNDGLLDLFVVNYVQIPLEAAPVCKDPGQKLRVYCHPRNFRPQANTLYRNRGDGTFEDVTAKSGIDAHAGKGMGLAIADYDSDGFPDVFVTNDTMANFLFRNRGDGSFEEVAFRAGVALNTDGKPVSAMGVDFRDLNNDGLPDLVFTALTGETFPLFLNKGKGQFQDATYISRMGPLTARLAGWGIAAVDFNNDGFKDIFTANSHVTDNIEAFSGDKYELPNTVFLNDGATKFQAGAALDCKHAHRGLAVADFNNDGLPDVVVSALGAPAEIWWNRSPSPGHWLDIQLQGTKSNRDGIGARIAINGQTNHQSSAFSYASSSHGAVHFGLGSSAKADLIVVNWPSGKVQTFRDVAADRVFKIVEP